MRISVEIPDELAAALAGSGQDPARSVVEAFGLEAYRRRRISAYQLRTLLGISAKRAPVERDFEGATSAPDQFGTIGNANVYVTIESCLTSGNTSTLADEAHSRSGCEH